MYCICMLCQLHILYAFTYVLCTCVEYRCDLLHSAVLCTYTHCTYILLYVLHIMMYGSNNLNKGNYNREMYELGAYHNSKTWHHNSKYCALHTNVNVSESPIKCCKDLGENQSSFRLHWNGTNEIKEKTKKN